MTKIPAVLLIAALLAGCENQEWTPVGCDWFDGPNCWRDSVMAATECLADPEEPGRISDDGKECAFPDGTLIRSKSSFNKLFNFDPWNPDPWYPNLTIERDGQVCLHYRWAPMETTVAETTLGRFAFNNMGDTVNIVCPSREHLYMDCPRLEWEAEHFPECFEDDSCLKFPIGFSAGGDESCVSFYLYSDVEVEQLIFTCCR